MSRRTTIQTWMEMKRWESRKSNAYCMDDPMGGEVCAVDRARDKQLIRLMWYGSVGGLDTDPEIYAGELVLWDDLLESKAELHWHGHADKAAQVTYRPGWVMEDDDSRLHSYSNRQPHITDIYCRFQSHEAFIYWGPKEKSKLHKIQKHHQIRINRRMSLHISQKLRGRRSVGGGGGDGV